MSIKAVWSDITYKKNNGIKKYDWRVEGWKIYINGKKYPTERTYVWSTPCNDKGREVAIWRSLTQAGHPLARLKGFVW